MVFRKDIQGLRAIAFFMVFFFHLNHSWWPGGFLGVDLFFVISGFLMTEIITAGMEAKTFSFLDFYKKRILRIVPAYLVLLFFVGIAGSYIYLYVDCLALRDSLRSALFFVSNLYFAKGESYFGAGLNENPVLHTWSLAIEMQFYVVFPLLIFVSRKYLKWILSVIFVCLLIYTTIRMGRQDYAGDMFFSLAARMPEFLVGCFFALNFKKGLDFGAKWNNTIALFALTGFLVFSFLLNESSVFPGILAVISCVFAGSLLVIRSSWIQQILSTRFLVYIGKLSYSLYLWHWPLMAFIRYKYFTYELSTRQLIFVVVMTFVLGWLSYQFVEVFFRKFSVKKIIYLGVFALFTGGFISFLPNLMENKKDNDRYTKPIFGLKSHKEPVVEVFGDLKKTDKILLIGDSNALMLKPFFNQLGKQNGFSFRTITCNGFMPLQGVKYDGEGTKFMGMYNYSQSLVKIVNHEIQNADFIFICTVSYDNPSVIKALENVAMHLRENQKLILISSFPYLDKDPIRINDGFVRKSDEKFKISQRTKDLEIVKTIANTYSKVYYYNVGKSKIFRTAPYVNDTVIYYNDSHINTVGSEMLAKDLDTDFMSFFNEIKKIKTT